MTDTKQTTLKSTDDNHTTCIFCERYMYLKCMYDDLHLQTHTNYYLKVNILIDEYKNYKRINYGYYDDKYPIQYCPVCGRKLPCVNNKASTESNYTVKDDQLCINNI